MLKLSNLFVINIKVQTITNQQFALVKRCYCIELLKLLRLDLKQSQFFNNYR